MMDMSNARRIILNDNQPFADQVIYAGTTYVIQGDYDLKGKTVDIPKNCTLYFAGGSLSNGKVLANNTLLQGDIKCYIDFSGCFKNKFFETNWFTGNGVGLAEFLKKAIKTNVNDIVINSGIWPIAESIILRSNLSIRGEDGTIISLDRDKITGPFCLFRLWGNASKFEENYKYSNITLADICFQENGSNELGRTCILAACNAKDINIADCRFIDYDNGKYAEYVNAAITLYNCKDCKVEDCHTEYVRLTSMGFCVNCTVSRNKGYYSPGTWLESCDGHHLIYENNELYENLYPGNSSICQNSKYGIIRNNTIIVNGKEVDSMINIGHSSSDVYENSGDGCIIEGNVIQTAYSKGIIAWGDSKTDNLTIRNNKVYTANNHAIYLSSDIQTVYIVGNQLTGHSRNQILVRCEANESYIENNHITIDNPGEKYLPLRLRRADNKGMAIVRNNTIDNGGKAPSLTKDETIIDVSIGNCEFKNNIVNDGVHFLNVSPGKMVMTGNTFNDVQNVFWHSNNPAIRPLSEFKVRKNTINVNISKAGENLNLFSINGECDMRKGNVLVDDNAINYAGSRDRIVVNLRGYKGNGVYKESTKSSIVR